MRVMRPLYPAWLGLAALIGLSAIFASSAANTVPESGMGVMTRPIDASNLKPPECAGLELSEIIVGSGTIIGGGRPSLILGSAGPDGVVGSGGDCILGGEGNDILRGGGGYEVLIGGPGDDTLIGSLDGMSICYGGPPPNPNDRFENCAAIYP